MRKNNIHYFENRTSWKKWLIKNKDNYTELWILFYKKGGDKKGISYSEAVEEAICHGWIDSLVKKIDQYSYLRKFTPRKINSNWSPTNLARAEKMISTGQMQQEGMKLYKQFIQSGQKPQKSKASDPCIKLPVKYINILKDNPKAWLFFNQISPSAKRRYIAWINTPKKEATKLKRLNQAVSLLENNKLLGLK